MLEDTKKAVAGFLFTIRYNLDDSTTFSHLLGPVPIHGKNWLVYCARTLMSYPPDNSIANPLQFTFVIASLAEADEKRLILHEINKSTSGQAYDQDLVNGYLTTFLPAREHTVKLCDLLQTALSDLVWPDKGYDFVWMGRVITTKQWDFAMPFFVQIPLNPVKSNDISRFAKLLGR